MSDRALRSRCATTPSTTESTASRPRDRSMPPLRSALATAGNRNENLRPDVAVPLCAPERGRHRVGGRDRRSRAWRRAFRRYSRGASAPPRAARWIAGLPARFLTASRQQRRQNPSPNLPPVSPLLLPCPRGSNRRNVRGLLRPRDIVPRGILEGVDDTKRCWRRPRTPICRTFPRRSGGRGIPSVS